MATITSSYQLDEEAGDKTTQGGFVELDRPSSKPTKTAVRAFYVVGALVLLFLLRAAFWQSPGVDVAASVDARLQIQVDEHETFGEMARRLASQAFEETDRLLPLLNDRSGGADVHDLRKQVLRFRNVLDIFSAAFFPVGKSDVWHELRRKLAHLYVDLGQMQDADKDGQSDDTDLEAARESALHRKTQYLKLVRREDIRHFVNSPHGSTLYASRHTAHPRTHSKFFWGSGDNAAKPRDNASGLGNLAILLSHQFDQMDAHYNEAMSVSDHTLLEEHHETFHDFRKCVRAILGVTELVPEAMVHSHEDMRLAQRVYKKFGRINDEYNEMAAAKKHQRHDEAADIAVDIDGDLQQLKDWAGRQNVQGLASRLRRDLAVDPGAP